MTQYFLVVFLLLKAKSPFAGVFAAEILFTGEMIDKGKVLMGTPKDTLEISVLFSRLCRLDGLVSTDIYLHGNLQLTKTQKVMLGQYGSSLKFILILRFFQYQFRPVYLMS